MSPKNQRAPVGSSKTFAAAVAAASTSSAPPTSVSNATSVIIGVTASVGSVVLLVVAIRIWRCRRPPTAPLPPKGPLAHDRLRRLAAEDVQFELPVSVLGCAQGIVPLVRNTANSPYDDYSRQSCSRTDVTSIPPSSSSIVSSQGHLVPPESDENAEMRRGRQRSLGSPSSAVRQHQGYRSRTISNTGSIRSTRSRQSSQGTIRGPPHHRHINIVLPQPLAPGLYNINTLQQPHTRHSLAKSRRSTSRDREHRTGRVCMDDSSSSAREPAPHIFRHHESGAAYAPLAPSLRTEYERISRGDKGKTPTSPSTPQPHVSHALSANSSSPMSPNASVSLLRQSIPSPDRAPPPPLPPKDFPPRRSSRPRRNSESAVGRPRP